MFHIGDLIFDRHGVPVLVGRILEEDYEDSGDANYLIRWADGSQSSRWYDQIILIPKYNDILKEIVEK